MRYSLLSRFRGTLFGAVLGESLAKGEEKNNREISDNFPRLVIPGAKSLIKQGKLDLDDWLGYYQQEFAHSSTTNRIRAKIIFATIPVALFFHENPVKLRQNLLRVLKMGDHDPVVQDATLALGYAIARSLTEKLQPHHLIPEIIAFIGESQTSLPQNLIKINHLLAQGAGLERLQPELSREETLSGAISLAFYCFLSTIEDFRLSVLRAYQLKSVHSQTIAILTGALSGSYHTHAGIPAYWQVALLPTNSKEQAESNLWQMLELADNLAAVWAGVYDVALHSSNSLAPGLVSNPQVYSSVYAAPRVMGRHEGV